MKTPRKLSVFVFVNLVWIMLTSNVCAANNFRVANLYSNNMVLQMQPKSTQIWGYGSRMFAEIELSFNFQSFYTTVLPNMTWYVHLTPQPAGGPHNIIITQTSIYDGDVATLQLDNIVFGDVWLCVGEANMAFPMKNIYNSSDEIARVKRFGHQIRYAKVISETSGCSESSNDVSSSWGCIDCEPVVELNDFSATCLLYGMEISNQKPDRTIGLILAVQLPSPIEAWGSKRVTQRCNSALIKDCSHWFPKELSLNKYWNNTIYPLTFMAIRGVLWNQGESNVGYGHDQYNCHLINIYNDFRSHFFDGNVPVPQENGIAFPFGIIQLGSMKSGRKDAWGSLRWLQTLQTGILPSGNYDEFFMASTYDLTDKDSPFGTQEKMRFFVITRDKQTAAKRLASAAGTLLYNTSKISFGPYSVRAERGASGIVGLTFSSNLEIRGNQGFTYRTSKGEWIAAPKFLQISSNKVGVAIPEDATHLAYAWSATVCEYLTCALYSAGEDALPVQPWIWELRSMCHINEYCRAINQNKFKPKHGGFSVSAP